MWFNWTVPAIASKKKWCGACQLNDRKKCIQLDEICWDNYRDGRVWDPKLNKDCLKAIAPLCYNIWVAGGQNDPQCLDFSKSMNFLQMGIVPSLTSAAYSSSGKKVLLRFSTAIRQDRFVDCSTAFTTATLNWLPASKACSWTSKSDLEVDFDPSRGIMKELTIDSKTFYYDYEYAQAPTPETTTTVKMPPLNVTLQIKGITAVSACDNVELFGSSLTPTLYPLQFAWEIAYQPAVTGKLASESGAYFSSYKQFSETSTLTIPSRLLKYGNDIQVTLKAKAASEQSASGEVKTSTMIKIFGSMPKIKFSSKSASVLELDGNKSNSVPLQIDTSQCGADSTGDEGANVLIPVEISFGVASGNSQEVVTTKGSAENELASKMNEKYKKLKAVFVSSAMGFQYGKYYNITANIKDKISGKINSDCLIIFISKPAIEAVIDSPGSLVSIEKDVTLKGHNSKFPVLGSDKKSFNWKCINATAMAIGGSCDCPILTDAELSNTNLKLKKEKLVSLCKYSFSLTVSAVAEKSKRTASDSTEFMTFTGPATPCKSKVVPPDDPEVNDIYLTLGMDTTEKTGSGNYTWVLTEVESTDPRVEEKYSEKNKFVFNFFKEKMGANIDPAIKKGDVNKPAKGRRRLADLTPRFTSGPNVRVLALDKTTMLPMYKYNFAVITYAGDKPTFLFVPFTMPPAPRARNFAISPANGTGFSTQFGFTFTLTSSNAVDDAQYQLFRKNCPGSNNTMSPLTQKFSKSNSYKATLAPGLKACNYSVEITLKIFEYENSLNMVQTVMVEEPEAPLQEALGGQVDQLTSNPDLTMDQKLSIMAEVSNVNVTEETPQSKNLTQNIFKELNATDAPGGVIDSLEDKDKVALISTATTTMASLVTSHAASIDVDMASTMADKVDSMLNKVNASEGAQNIIPAAVSALSGIATLGAKKETDNKFYENMQNTMKKMNDMKMNTLLPGSTPYVVKSAAIDMVVSKTFADDYAKNQTVKTGNGVNIGLPDALKDALISSMNMTTDNPITFGTSISSTSFNPLKNIKNCTAITNTSLTNGSTQGFLPSTVQKIYEDLGKGKLEDLVNKKEQEAPLVQVSFKPYELNNDASETKLNVSGLAPVLPEGKEVAFSIPVKQDMSEIVNKTIIVPLYYDAERQMWSNENCSLDTPKIGDTVLTMRCSHMGRGTPNSVNEGFSVTVDIVKDVFKVIKAGNYQQLIDVGALMNFNGRTMSAFSIAAATLVFAIVTTMILVRKDREDILRMKIKCLFKKFEKTKEVPDSGILVKIVAFFSKLKNRGMSSIIKRKQQTVKPDKSVGEDEHKLTMQKDPDANKGSNGFTRLSLDEVKLIRDCYEMYQQCLLVYTEYETQMIMSVELENNKILARKTQQYIDNIILYEKVTLWTLLMQEHQLINAFTKPEITNPRALKFLVFITVLVGELFVTGYFHDADATKGIDNDPNGFITSSLIFSIAATVLMVPMKIIITLFMSGKPLNDNMTREEVERADANRGTLQKFGIGLGIGLITVFTYGIMMYVVTFSEIALSNWLITFGISAFTEIFVMAPVKVLFKLTLGVLLMKVSRVKWIFNAIGTCFVKIIDWISSVV